MTEAPGTIHGLIAAAAASQPDVPAIEASGRSPLSYRQLDRCVQGNGRESPPDGLDRNDRVGIVLPNGPEAVAFLGIASAASAAPLNPAYRAEDKDGGPPRRRCMYAHRSS